MPYPVWDEHTLSSAKQKKTFDSPPDKCLQDQDKHKLKLTNKPEMKQIVCYQDIFANFLALQWYNY